MREALNSLTYMGILLIILGLIMVLIPLIERVGVRAEKLHPIIFIGRRFDGVFVGTSPLLIIVLILLYLFLFMRR